MNKRLSLLHSKSKGMAKAALTVMLILAPLLASAQKVKDKVSLFGIGYTDILDTYISQEKATGPELRYVYEGISRKDSSRISRLIMHQGFISKGSTRGNDDTTLSGMYNLKLGWHYNWDSPSQHINIKAGGLADLSLGGTYNTRNSNNPAQARMSLTVDPSVLATWHFKIKDKPLTLHYEASMPLAGAAFSPNYGQSYYEIFSKGNYDHNIVFVSPFSGVQLHHILALDFRLWRTTFTIGYLGDIRQMEANDLKYHQWTHSVVIGWRY